MSGMKVSCDTKNEKNRETEEQRKKNSRKMESKTYMAQDFRITLSDHLCVLWNSSFWRGFVKAAGRK
mgnify:CR=1 FL=1